MFSKQIFFHSRMSSTALVMYYPWSELRKREKKSLHQFLFENQGWAVYTSARYAGINAVLENVNFLES